MLIILPGTAGLNQYRLYTTSVSNLPNLATAALSLPLLFCPEEPSPEPDEPTPTPAGVPPAVALAAAAELDDEVLDDGVLEDEDVEAVALLEF